MHFGAIPPAVVDELLADEMIVGCAGGLMAETQIIQPCIERIDGGMDAVMGLCVEDVLSLIGRLTAQPSPSSPSSTSRAAAAEAEAGRR